MILIADSGSTKTHWCLKTRSGQKSDFMTEGINPFHQSEDAIRHILTDGLLPQLAKYLWVGPIEHIYFYGAGCTPEKCVVMKALLEEVFRKAEAEVYSDMVGAAIGVLCRERGVACILGTGSNSCLWDGEKIVRNVPSLGYILGDEGSGAVLGRTLVGDVLKGLLGEELKKQFAEWTLDNDGLSRPGGLNDGLMRAQAHVIERVYRQPMANRFLAEMSKFCAAHRGDEAIEALLKRHFAAFRDRVVAQYRTGTEELTVSFVGSIAWYYRDVLEEVMTEGGFKVGKIVKEPMGGMATELN